MSGRPILVTGAGGPAGRSLVRQLQERGLPVVGVDAEPVEIPGVDTRVVPLARSAAFVPVLLARARDWGARLVVPTVSEELPALAAHVAVPDPPGHRVPIVVGDRAAVALADDKWLTERALRDAGLTTPRTLWPVPDDPDGVAGPLGLPFLTKPRVGRGGRGVVLHAQPPSARTEWGARVLAQEFLPGTEYGPNVYVAAEPDDDVVVVLEKVGLAQGAVGNATSVRRVEAQDVAALARAAARALGLRGPVDVDIRRRASGEPAVLELNARFGANSAHAPEMLDALLGEYAGPVDTLARATR
ncbi:ATP-grasp domain-containing protein [Occultella kanbiaonis]|uniref:ATP-grasp domain-containing protein n=1 Tax=Occultella kanbiaonis TaxID=2675754 RepID=UPI00158076A0|nr:ATP-grasp domain-containing protein [Occultella kanbiaonis]